MPLPRKGILIRFVVYGTLIAFFGWRAWDRHQEEKAAEAAATSPSGETGLPSREYRLPDGRSVEVLEVTPEQAQEMFGVPPRIEAGEAAPSPGGVGEAKAPAEAAGSEGEAKAAADAAGEGAPAAAEAGAN
ncbi:MAG: hypothetical protein H6711_21390 [Myxococcales bacterium]|nr:hypothetical protein [Myxococcales bacterium]